MPLVTQKVDLKDSFSYTNLDLQDSGPINVPSNNHQQQWTPSSEFTQDPKGQKQDGVLRYKGFDGPGGLDLENNGPINVANYNHQQQWTPTTKYSDDPQGQKQGGILDSKGFDGPNGLDLENNGPINAPLYNHQQNYTPSAGFIQSDQGQRAGGKLRTEGFDGVGELDLENNGPRNVAEYKHEQLYTPNSTYENILKEQGLEKGSKLYTKGFDKNYNGRGYGGDFDIENNDPNRSNPLGAKSSNVIFSTLNGRTIQTQTQHQYTPKNPYISTGDPVVGTAGGGNDINAATGASNQL